MHALRYWILGTLLITGVGCKEQTTATPDKKPKTKEQQILAQLVENDTKDGETLKRIETDLGRIEGKVDACKAETADRFDQWDRSLAGKVKAFAQEVQPPSPAPPVSPAPAAPPVCAAPPSPDRALCDLYTARAEALEAETRAIRAQHELYEAQDVLRGRKQQEATEAKIAKIREDLAMNTQQDFATRAELQQLKDHEAMYSQSFAAELHKLAETQARFAKSQADELLRLRTALEKQAAADNRKVIWEAPPVVPVNVYTYGPYSVVYYRPHRGLVGRIFCWRRW